MTLLSISQAIDLKCTVQSNGGYYDDALQGPSKVLQTAKFYDLQVSDDSATYTVKSGSDTSVRALWFATRILNFLPNVLFKAYPHAYYIWIGEGLDFTTFKQEHFEGAGSLRVIYNYGNKVEELTSKVFYHASNLEYINLRRNRIASVHHEAFYGLTNLKGLYLRDNLIKSLSFLHFQQSHSLTSFDLISLIGGNHTAEINEANMERLLMEIAIIRNSVEQIEAKC